MSELIGSLHSIDEVDAVVLSKPQDPKILFSKALKEALENKNDQSIDNSSLVRSWVHGECLPCEGSGKILKELERISGVKPGSLTQFIPYSYKKSFMNDTLTGGINRKPKYTYVQTEFAKHSEKLRALSYYFPYEMLPPEILKYLILYERWHIEPFPPIGLIRKEEWEEPKGKWRWKTNIKGKNESRERWIAFTRAFFGFLILPKEFSEEEREKLKKLNWNEEDIKLAAKIHVGMGLKVDDLRITMLADQNYVKYFTQFQAARTLDGNYGNTQKCSAGICASLGEKEYGFFWQLAEQFINEKNHHLEGKCETVKTLREWLEEQFTKLRSESNKIGKRATKKRSLDRDLDEILKWERPGDVYFKLLDQLKQEAFLIRNNRLLDQARHWQDIMLITALFAIPLRCINWSAMRIDKHFRWENEGQDNEKLIITVKKEEFKNSPWLINDYVVEVSPIFLPYFKAYLKYWRPILPGTKAGSQFFFPATLCHHKCKNEKSHEMLQSTLSDRVRLITKRILKKSLGVHWIRHVAATDYLIANPDKYEHVATILNDSLNTVLNTYRRAMDSRRQMLAYGSHMVLSENKYKEKIYQKE